MKNTKIFITTPCFNMKETIDRTISSVLLQSGDFEIYYHVQDGGSTDGTVELLKTWDVRVTQKQLPVSWGKLLNTLKTSSYNKYQVSVHCISC